MAYQELRDQRKHSKVKFNENYQYPSKYSHESTVCLANASSNSFVLSGVYLKCQPNKTIENGKRQKNQG